MRAARKIMAGLENTPALLKDLLSDVSAERIVERRIPGKWRIHEHAVHLWKVQLMINQRMERFLKEKNPEFVSYIPGKTTPNDELIQTDLKTAVKGFAGERRRFVSMLKRLGPDGWKNRAKHPEYDEYTPYIMARHVFLHDNIHMYRIEELWMTRDLAAK